MEEKYEKLVEIIKEKKEQLKRKRESAIRGQRVKYANHLLYRINLLEDILKEAGVNE